MTPPVFRSLKGITALVTGASSGIGEALARELAAQGAHLILVARSKERLGALAAGLEETCRVRTSFFDFDLSLPESPFRLFEVLQEKGWPVDLLVNNAGLGCFGRFEETDLKNDSALLTVNVHSVAVLTHLFIGPMLEKGRGGILNVASTAAFQPLPFLSLYAATKSFVLAFSEALWGEYRHRGIRVLCLCPGNTKTRFHERAGIGRRKVFLTAKADRVARHAIKVFMTRDCPTTVDGFWNRVLTLGYRLLPRKRMTAITERIYRPSGQVLK